MSLILSCKLVEVFAMICAVLLRNQAQDSVVLQHYIQRFQSPPSSGKSGPKDQVALLYYYTSPSHWCTTHEVSKW